MSMPTSIAEVIAVSVGGVSVQLNAQSSAGSLSVGGLCLIQDEVSKSQIVAVVESIRGKVLSELNPANVDAVYPVAQLTILGQIRNDGSGDKPTFKRGTDSFPVLGSKCSELTGDRLNELLSSVTASFREEDYRLDSCGDRTSSHPPAGIEGCGVESRWGP